MMIDSIPSRKNHPYRFPFLRWIGRIVGFIYLLVTLLFGPIKPIATWFQQQRFIQRYQSWVSSFPPAWGLAISLSSLVLLELSKIAVLLTFRHAGWLAAILVTLFAKASIGYFAHITWRAARPKVIEAYQWAARIDAWVETQMAKLRAFRDHWSHLLKHHPGYLAALRAVTILKRWLH